MTLKKRSPQVNMLEGSIFPALLRFAIPVLFSNLFQQLYNTTDTIIVGHTLGEASLAAMGAAAPVYDLLIGFALGIGNGLSLVAARNFGAGKEDLLKRSVAGSVCIGIGISLVLTLGSCAFLKPFLRLLNTPEEILMETYAYICVILLFTGVMFAYNLCAGLLNAIGNSFVPLVFLVFSSLLNIGLDYLFIIGFHMGIRGAAVATVLAQGISVVLCILYIFRSAKLLLPEKAHFSVDRAGYAELLSQGLAMGFMSCFVYAGSAILQTGINDLGYLVIAGHTAARKVFLFCLMPFIAIASALSTFVSQNYGAGNFHRIRSAVKYAYAYNAAMTLLITGLLHGLAPELIGIISGSQQPLVLQNGSRYLQVVAPCYFILGFVNTSRNSLQAMGSKVLPILSSILELIGKILFVLLLIPKYQYDAVIFCEPVIWCFMAAELLSAFWLHPKIRSASKI